MISFYQPYAQYLVCILVIVQAILCYSFPIACPLFTNNILIELWGENNLFDLVYSIQALSLMSSTVFSPSEWL